MPTTTEKNPGVYVTNGSGGTINHGAPVKEGNFVGLAIKQKARAWSAGFVSPLTIANGEKYFIQTVGVVEVPTVSGFAQGDAIYITDAGVLTETNTGNTPFGRVVETVSDNRGVPTGKVRIDLDIKNAVTAATF